MAITGASGAPYAVRLLEALVAGAAARAAHRVRSRAAAAAHRDRHRHGRGASRRVSARAAWDASVTAVRRQRSRRRAGVGLGAQSRHGDLSVLDGDDQRDRQGHVALARRARGGRRAQGAAHAHRSCRARRRTARSTSRTCCALTRAGAVVLPASPGFYHRPTSIDELVDFVVARVLDHLGVEHALGRRWGDAPEDA